MKITYAFLFLMMWPLSGLYAQNIPKADNKTDSSGLRQGKWVILYDGDWKVVEDTTKVKFYRLIGYKDDLPQDTVKDYYRSGKIQWEGKLLRDKPKEIKEGKCVWYDESGKAQEIGWYEKGKLVKSEKYDTNGTKKEKLSAFELGLKYYQAKEYHKALLIFEQYKNIILNFSEDEMIAIYTFSTILVICYKKTGQLEKAQELAPSLKKLEAKLLNTWGYLNLKGKNLYRLGKYSQAFTILKKAKFQAEKEYGKVHVNYATACNNLALLYQSQGLYAKAKSLYLEAKNIDTKILGKNHPAYAGSCNNLAGLYQSQGLYAKAESLYLEAKGIVAQVLGKHHPNYASSCNNLAELYWSQGLYVKAEPLYVEAKGIRAQVLGKHHPDYASSCNNLAELYRSQGLYAKAESLCLEAKGIRTQVLGKHHPDYAQSCNNLALLHESQGLYAKAEPLYLEAKSIRIQVLGKHHPDYAQSCDNLAELYRLRGLYAKAQPLYLEAKSIRIQVLGKHHPDYAQSCNNLALLYESQGLYAKAESLYLEAKNINTKTLGKNHPDYASSCNNLAALYFSQGLYMKAEPLYLEAKGIRAQILGKHHPDYAQSCNNLAVLYHKKGLYVKAESFYMEAKNIRAQTLGTSHPDYAQSCNNLAGFYQLQGLYAKAEALYLEAKGIRAQVLGKHHPDYAISCNSLATLYYKKDLYPQAKLLCQKAKNIRAKVFGKTHPTYAASCNNLAALYRSQGLYAKAELLYREAKGIHAKALGENHPDYEIYCNNLAVFYWDQQSYLKGFSLFQETFLNLNQQIKQNLAFTGENERRQFLQANINDNYQVYYSFVHDYVDSLGIAQSDSVLRLAYQNHLLTKSVLFNSTQKTKERIYNSKDTATIKLYNQFIETRTRYNKALELTKEKRKLNGISLEALNEKADSLEKVLARKSTAFAKNLEEYQPHTWQEVQQKLQPDEAAIEIIRFNWYNHQWTDTMYYVALIVTPHSKFPYPVFLKNGNFLEGKAYRFYRKANAQQRTEDNASYNLFWQPIHQQLKKLYPEVKRVFVSLDGVYNKINLETLRNPKTGKYLGDALDIRLVSNTKDLLNRDKPTITSTSKVIGLFGFPDYRIYNQVDTLPIKVKQKMLGGTAKEVNAIYKQLKPSFIPQKFTHKAASEENIKSLKKPKVLHLATHGFFMADIKPKRTNQFQLLGRETHLFVENPLLRSGLYWAGADATLNQKSRPDSVKENGVLTAQEVLNMDLDSTQLVVLSACETGRGKIQNGEGVYGLQRAFLSAGVKNVLMSLWKVDDVATQYFMQYFYESWAKDENVRKAYRYAQNKLRADYPSPYYWGAFVLVGR